MSRTPPAHPPPPKITPTPTPTSPHPRMPRVAITSVTSQRTHRLVLLHHRTPWNQRPSRACRAPATPDGGHGSQARLARGLRAAISVALSLPFLFLLAREVRFIVYCFQNPGTSAGSKGFGLDISFIWFPMERYSSRSRSRGAAGAAEAGAARRAAADHLRRAGA